MLPKSAKSDDTRIDLLAKSLRNIPDELVAIQLDLRPLCEGEIEGMPDTAKKTVVGAYATLNKSIGRIMIALEYIDDWTGGMADQTQPPHRAGNVDGDGKKSPV